MELIQCYKWIDINDGSRLQRRCSTLIPASQHYCADHQIQTAQYDRSGGFDTNSEDIGNKPIEEHRIVAYLPTMQDELVYKHNEVITVNDWQDPPPLIDAIYASNLGVFKNYRGKQMLKDIHFRFQLHGTRDAIDLFHALLSNCDNDYPLKPFGKRTEKVERCKKCQGYLWKQATVEPEAIKRAAKQAGIICKPKLWVNQEKCRGEMEKVMLGSV